MRVMVIAGTGDGREIVGRLLQRGWDVVATVTTNYGQELLKAYPGVRIYQGTLDSAGILNLIKNQAIFCLVDASHPFAREVSLNAMKACDEAAISYLRFERNNTLAAGANIHRVTSFEAAADTANRFAGNIFLTIGSNNLKIFVEKITDYQNRLFVRILPDSRMVLKCEEAGLTAGQIMAMKGPFSVQMNLEMLRFCQAAVMVTKESGPAGGTDTKLEAAARLNLPVVVVERPEINYPQKVGSIEEVLEFLRLYPANVRGCR
jgi:precorrin-6A/cobalt-precorrin-6A reductase